MTEYNPCWEWRIFDKRIEWAERQKDKLGVRKTRESSEVYFLTPECVHNVKIRAGKLDVKYLLDKESAGIELWVRRFKAPLPVPGAILTKTLNYLDCDTAFIDQKRKYSQAMIAGALPDGIRTVGVDKKRYSMTYNNCDAEWVEIYTGGERYESFSIESIDKERLMDSLRKLGLVTADNLNYIEFLRNVHGIK
ncbi:MAG: hypothetical protein GF307_10915 [candidate division Zixibacteria bacterium]|nr:hypothetical protein [candidate division Zixibacteria bacterium]